MSRILFSVLFRIQRIIQGIIQSTFIVVFDVWFRIQGIIKKCPGYYSDPGLVFRILFKIRPAASGSGLNVLFKIVHSASGSGFSVLFKNAQGIIQLMVQYLAYY